MYLDIHSCIRHEVFSYKVRAFPSNTVLNVEVTFTIFWTLDIVISNAFNFFCVL